jgi:hypothetical protein
VPNRNEAQAAQTAHSTATRGDPGALQPLLRTPFCGNLVAAVGATNFVKRMNPAMRETKTELQFLASLGMTIAKWGEAD